MIVLHAFALQLGAILWFQQIRLSVRVGGIMLALAALVELEP